MRGTGVKTGMRTGKTAIAKANGYTLLELLVVLAILTLIAAMATPQVMKFLGKAKTDIARVQIDNIAAALNLYRLENDDYPATLDALVTAPDAAPHWRGPYLDNAGALSDPWGRAYQYRKPGTQDRPFDLYSLGADGQDGGEGDDADIYR